MNKTAILTTIPSDSHSWNLIFIQKFLEESGVKVINLGVCVPYEEVHAKCNIHKPEYLVVSTINGHGYMEGVELGSIIKKNNHFSNMKMVIGGKLHVNTEYLISHLSRLYNVGYDAVYYNKNSLDEFDKMLSNSVTDLGQRFIDTQGSEMQLKNMDG